METVIPELPTDLWHIIALCLVRSADASVAAYIDPEPYWVLVRVSHQMAMSNMKTILRWEFRTADTLSITLPNGDRHCDNGPAIIYCGGTEEWYQDGECHRDNGLPAVVTRDWAMGWYKRDLLHRENGLPAVILGSGHQEWSREGPDNGLMVIDEWGSMMWGKYGGYHRNVLPAVIQANSSQEWWVDDALHRSIDDLPAVIAANGTQEWWKDGKRHRIGGPAVIYADGTCEWWENDVLER